MDSVDVFLNNGKVINIPNCNFQELLKNITTSRATQPTFINISNYIFVLRNIDFITPHKEN